MASCPPQPPPPSPAPTFPPEIKAAVFALCDQATLAILCLVSLETLELAGPLLYARIELHTLRQAQLLFCDLVNPRLLCALLEPSSVERVGLTLSLPLTHAGRLNPLRRHLALPVPLPHTDRHLAHPKLPYPPPSHRTTQSLLQSRPPPQWTVPPHSAPHSHCRPRQSLILFDTVHVDGLC